MQAHLDGLAGRNMAIGIAPVMRGIADFWRAIVAWDRSDSIGATGGRVYRKVDPGPVPTSCPQQQLPQPDPNSPSVTHASTVMAFCPSKACGGNSRQRLTPSSWRTWLVMPGWELGVEGEAAGWA